MRLCPSCGGNDGDMPCAYPGEAMRGCLRDKRLREEINQRVAGYTAAEIRERIRRRVEDYKRSTPPTNRRAT